MLGKLNAVWESWEKVWKIARMTRNRSLENTEPSQPATDLPANFAAGEWLSTREAAEARGVTRALVHRRVTTGEIASVRLGRYYYVHRDA